MTPEQLDEIEALAEEATPDPWCVVIRGSEVTIETTGRECFVVAEMPRSGATDVHDATFIRAMREYALPLVKALREAREEHERNRAEWDLTVARLTREVFHIAEARNEAQAEVERLNKRLESEQHFIDAACHYRNLAIVLGAKPEQMLGTFDRELCEGGIDPNDTSGGYHVSVNQQLDELKDVWAEVERLREAARQVHALASVLVMDWDVLRIGQAVHEIHKITKGMVE